MSVSDRNTADTNTGVIPGKEAYRMTQQQPRIYLSSPHMSGDELPLIREAFDTNWIAPLGPHVEGFERELAERIGVSAALALNSGTAALHLGLRLLGIGAGDRVFCSSFTFIASVSPVVWLGAKPVFIDSDPETWNMSPQALRQAFNDRLRTGKLPKAVVIVNLYGQSANYAELKAICDAYSVPVIEDAAESLGAVYQGKASGTIGAFGILSFNGNKIITTSGGGMLISNNLQAIAKARFLSTQARDCAPHYQHSEMGYNYRMSNILAGIGRGQLQVLDDRVKTRRAIFARYREELSLPGIEFMPEYGGNFSTHWLSALTIDPAVTGISASDVIKKLSAENIESRPIWKPMHRQPVFRGYDYYPHEKGFSVSDRLFAQGLCLPSGSSLSEADQTMIIGIIKDLL